MENENKIMEGLSEQVVQQGVKTSNGSMIAKIVVGVLGAAAGVGAAIYYKKKKNSTVETDVETEVTEVTETDNKENNQ